MSNGPIEFFLLSSVTLLGVYSVMDIVKSNSKNTSSKATWILVALLLPFLGPLLSLYMA